MPGRHFILLFLLLNLSSFPLKAQTIILKKYPKVDVKISFTDSIFKATDKVEFVVTITNNEKFAQKLLFGKPGTYSTWGMIAKITTLSGKAVKLDEPDQHMMDSHFYSEKEEEEKGIFQIIKPGEKLSHMVDLKSLVWFNFGTNDIPAGNYRLAIYYFGNHSNTITFSVRK